MLYKGDTLCLLPQEKEICVKMKAKEQIGKYSSFEVDCSSLYISKRFVKKGWRMFISRPLEKVYILTGSARIMTEYLCGNAVLSAKSENVASFGQFYVSVPYLCTSVSDYQAENHPRVKAKFTPTKIYSDKTGFFYVVGILAIYENLT